MLPDQRTFLDILMKEPHGAVSTQRLEPRWEGQLLKEGNCQREGFGLGLGTERTAKPCQQLSRQTLDVSTRLQILSRFVGIYLK